MPAITDLHSLHTKVLYDPAIVCGGQRAWRVRERAKAMVSRRSEGCTVCATQHARHHAHEEKRGWGGGVDGAARPGLLQHSVGHCAMWAELQVVVGVLARAEQQSITGLGHVEDRTVSVCMPQGREDGAAGPLRVTYCSVRPWAQCECTVAGSGERRMEMGIVRRLAGGGVYRNPITERGLSQGCRHTVPARRCKMPENGAGVGDATMAGSAFTHAHRLRAWNFPSTEATSTISSSSESPS
ncbi:hypothetical protein B0H14DRAFT_2611250 [Mycena olivaceomarginata]|nr:hypothetical protein B0H14DRAFT_2611250 [Mycena olivaceomarginata]